jgi:hypothetical protein
VRQRIQDIAVAEDSTVMSHDRRVTAGARPFFLFAGYLAPHFPLTVQQSCLDHYCGHNIASGFAMIRQGAWKYIYHSAPDREHPAVRELYDLAADPDELRDLARAPGHRRRLDSMHAAMLRELREHPDVTEMRCRAEVSRGYPQPV